jgi:glutamine synthetase
VKEAAKRKLGNVKNMVHALDAYLTKKSKDLFERHGVMSEKEVEARVEIGLGGLHQTCSNRSLV